MIHTNSIGTEPGWLHSKDSIVLTDPFHIHYCHMHMLLVDCSHARAVQSIDVSLLLKKIEQHAQPAILSGVVESSMSHLQAEKNMNFCISNIIYSMRVFNNCMQYIYHFHY